MADFSQRPSWWAAPEGGWHPAEQRSGRSPGIPSARHPGAAAPGAGREFRVGRALRDGLRDGEMIFSDRRLAGIGGSTGGSTGGGTGGGVRIDLLVVAPSGVWVIDAKKWSAVSFRLSDRTGSVSQLRAGNQDLTALVVKLREDLAPVRGIVRDPSVPVRPAVAVLPEQCRLAAGLRFRLGKPVWCGDVLVGPPTALLQQIRRPGPLSHDQVVHIGHRLDEALLPG